jgi:hypothetical protein
LSSHLLRGLQKIEKEHEWFNSEKREGPGGPRFQSPLEVVVLAMERMEKTAEDLGREGRGAWEPLKIRSDNIEGQHRKEAYLK